MTVENQNIFSVELLLPYNFLSDLCRIYGTADQAERKTLQWVTKSKYHPSNETKNAQNDTLVENSIKLFTELIEFETCNTVKICLEGSEPIKQVLFLSDLCAHEIERRNEGNRKIETFMSRYNNVSSTHEMENHTMQLVSSPKTNKPISDNAQTCNDNYVHVKRKRGRPKKIKNTPDLPGENLQQSHEFVKKTVCTSALEKSHSNKRYGLRGAKLSESIMKAVKSDIYGIQDNDEMYANNEQLSTSEFGRNNISNVEKFEEIDDEECLPEPDDEDDEDFKLYSKKKSSKKPRLSGVKHSVKPMPRHKKHSKIDFGDEIPKYLRRQRNNSKVAECKFCHKKFCDYTGVDKHVRLLHGDLQESEKYLESITALKISQCSVCYKEFPDRFKAQAHELSEHFYGTTFRCKHCQKLFKNMQALQNHISMVHNVTGQPYQCKLCSSKFKWATTLANHVAEIHEGKLPFVCEVCHKKFARKTQLKHHQRIHGLDPSKKLECEKCGKGFWYECNYKRHMRMVHEPQQERFHCSYCGKGFSAKNSMINHVQHVHLNIFPHKCSYCKKGFRRKTFLEDHVRIVHNISDAVTSTRNRRFKYGRDSDDLFFCSHCSLTFCYKTKMVEHMHTDHGKDFPFVCSFCCQGFLVKSYLITHLQQAHNKTLEESVQMMKQDFNQEGEIVDVNPPDHDLGDESSKNGNFEEQSINDIEQDLTNEIEQTSILQISEAGEIIQTSRDKGEPVLFQVASSTGTIHYIIEPSEDGTPTVLPEEISSLILGQGQSVQVITDNSNTCILEDGGLDAEMDGTSSLSVLVPSENNHNMIIEEAVKEIVPRHITTEAQNVVKEVIIHNK